MNINIIFLIIVLIVIIIYFRYKINEINVEKFLEGDVNVNTIINNLESNYLSITDTGNLAIKTNTGESLNISLSNNVINLGNDIKVDPSNNSLQCKKIDIDKYGNAKNTEKNIIVDPSGNITVDNFIFNKNGNFTRKDNSLKTDSNGNITFGNFIFDNNKNVSKNNGSFKIDTNGNIDTRDYIYSTVGKLIKKDGTYQIDPSGIIMTNEYTINTKDKIFNKNDNSIIDTPDKMKCGDYESDKKNIAVGNRIKIGQNYYNIKNGTLSNDTLSIDSNNLFTIKPDQNTQYSYNITKNELSGNENTNKQFLIPNPTSTYGSQLFLGNNAIYNYNGLGSTIYKVSKIVLEKPNSANTYINPLQISSIRFYDYNDQVILPGLYTVTLSNIADGQYNSASASISAKYYDSTLNKNTSYGGPKVDSYSLFLNKTISYIGNSPQIDTSSYQDEITKSNGNYAIGKILLNSFGYAGHGYCSSAYQNGITKPVTSSVTQSYTFTFTQPVYIKYVEIENRKDVFNDAAANGASGFNRIMGSYIDTYLNNITFDSTKNRIYCVRGTTGNSSPTGPIITLPPLTLSSPNGSLLPPSNDPTLPVSLSSYNATKTQPKRRIEKYTSVNYTGSKNNTFSLDANNIDNFDPIVRYYLQ